MGLNIDELLPDDVNHDKVTEQVTTLRRTHGRQFPPGYALSWVIANQVIQRYYGRLGLDAIPIWRENFGWSQFSLTRATNCLQPPNKNDESLRYIVFDGIAVNWGNQGDNGAGNEAQYDVYNAIFARNMRPNVAVREAVDHLGLDEQESFDHSSCLHGALSYAYKKLFQVATDLICHAPEMVGRRELNVDLDSFGNSFEEKVHPLRQTGLAEPGMTREWFELLHIPTHSRIFINTATGDLVRTDASEISHILDYPGWNERNEEQLTAYIAQMLGVRFS